MGAKSYQRRITRQTSKPKTPKKHWCHALCNCDIVKFHNETAHMKFIKAPGDPKKVKV